MWVLVFRELWTEFARSSHHGPCYFDLSARFRIGLFDGVDDQAADGCARVFGALAKLLVQRLGDIDGGSDCHDIIMSQVT